MKRSEELALDQFISFRPDELIYDDIIKWFNDESLPEETLKHCEDIIVCDWCEDFANSQLQFLISEMQFTMKFVDDTIDVLLRSVNLNQKPEMRLEKQRAITLALDLLGLK